jgi:hypothetical protein
VIKRVVIRWFQKFRYLSAQGSCDLWLFATTLHLDSDCETRRLLKSAGEIAKILQMLSVLKFVYVSCEEQRGWVRRVWGCHLLSSVDSDQVLS